MFEEIVSLLTSLNSLSPLGVIGLLVVVILLMVHKNGPIKKIANNHLEHVQGTLEKIAESSDKQVDLLVDIKADIAFVKGKLD